jgi:hypothetical protein
MEWYNYFNKKGEKNLIDGETFEDENLLVCQQLEYRRYTKFKNFAEFSQYHNSSDEKCFYEMMRETDGRKPYFDIDIDDISFDYIPMIEELKNILIKIISKKVKILVFDSSTKTKLSFHIVVDNFYLQTYKELLCFFDSIKEKISEEYKIYLDRSVYKSVQQFRIVGSHKWGKENTKKLREDLSYKFTIPKRIKNEKGKFNFILASSLITNVSSCNIIYGFQPKVEEKELNIFGNAQESDVEDVLKIFYDKYSCGDFQFQECKEKNGNLLIILRRLNSTYCESCKRYHENENPYITVTGEYRNIFFYCRRSDEKEGKIGISLGHLGLPNYSDVIKMKPVVISELAKNDFSAAEEDFMEEINMEEILEDIQEPPIFYTPRRKIEANKVLKGLITKSLFY